MEEFVRTCVQLMKDIITKYSQIENCALIIAWCCSDGYGTAVSKFTSKVFVLTSSRDLNQFY